MTAVDDVRAKLRDRQVKAGARGTVEEWLPLDLEQLEHLVELQTSLEDARRRTLAEAASTPKAAAATKRRLSDPAPVEVAKTPIEDPEVIALQAEVDAAEKAVRDNSLRLVFRSIGSQAYGALVNRHADVNDDPAGRQAFLNEQIELCLHEVWTATGDKLEGLTWADLAYPNGPDSEGPLGYGEWQTIANAVSALNQRTVDFPFSLRSSGPTRS